MIKIQIEIDDSKVTQMLQRLIDAGQNPRPALLEIGGDWTESTKGRFSSGVAPDGTPWERNSAVTIERKGRDKPLIGETGKLMDQIIHQLTGDDTLEMGSNREYAATQHFGAKQGQFGRNKRNAPIPWGDIPARPIFGMSSDDKTMIINSFNNYLRDQI